MQKLEKSRLVQSDFRLNSLRLRQLMNLQAKGVYLDREVEDKSHIKDIRN